MIKDRQVRVATGTIENNVSLNAHSLSKATLISEQTVEIVAVLWVEALGMSRGGGEMRMGYRLVERLSCRMVDLWGVFMGWICGVE